MKVYAVLTEFSGDAEVEGVFKTLDRAYLYLKENYKLDSSTFSQDCAGDWGSSIPKSGFVTISEQEIK